MAIMQAATELEGMKIGRLMTLIVGIALAALSPMAAAGHGGGFGGGGFHGAGGFHGGGIRGGGFRGSGFRSGGFRGNGFHGERFHHGNFNDRFFFFNGFGDPFFYYTYPYYGYYPYGCYPYDYSGDNNYNVDPADSATVQTVQMQLARRGYYNGSIDGVYGPSTRDAVARYQIGNQLTVTGSLSPDTLQSLDLTRATLS